MKFIFCLCMQFQGLPGLPGIPGEQGPDGIGLPGPKVQTLTSRKANSCVQTTS